MNTQNINNSNNETKNGMSQVIIDMSPKVKHQDGHGREVLADVYFRIDVQAYVNNFYTYTKEAREESEKACEAYYSEVVELLKAEGWTLRKEKYGVGDCPQMVKGTQYLYCHPQNISGQVNPADIEALEIKIKALTSCKFYETDNYGDIIVTTSESDEEQLYRDTYADGLASIWQEVITTKRSNLYKDKAEAEHCVRRRICIANRRADLNDIGTGSYNMRSPLLQFLIEEYDRLLKAGYIKEAEGRNGRTLCRWINKKEEKELNKARREAEKAEKVKETYKTGQHKALCDELCALLGYKAWEIKKDACTGKFAGSYDYSLKFEDGKELYICTRKDLFETNVTELIDGFKRTSKEGYKHGDMVKTKNSGRVAKVMRVGTVCEGYGTMLYLKEEGVAPKDNRFVEIHNLICSADEVEPLQPASEIKAAERQERYNARCKELEAEALAQMPYKVGDTVKSRDGVAGRVVEMHPEVTGDTDSPHLIYEYDGKPTVNAVILDADGKRHCAHWSFFTLQEESEIKDDSFFTKGKKYRCIKIVVMKKGGKTAFKAGSIYEQVSEPTHLVGWLRNEQGDRHAWPQPIYIADTVKTWGTKPEDIDPRLYFEPVEDTKETEDIREAEGVKIGDMVRHNLTGDRVATVTGIRRVQGYKWEGKITVYRLDFGESVKGPFGMEMNDGEYQREAFTPCVA